jgi:hypothetical protein
MCKNVVRRKGVKLILFIIFLGAVEMTERKFFTFDDFIRLCKDADALISGGKQQILNLQILEAHEQKVSGYTLLSHEAKTASTP